MTIKLVCIDMDGTLLMDDHHISEVDQDAIKEAVKQGVHVAITTGRVYNCAKLYAKQIGLITPIIASNGAYIGGTHDEIIYEAPLELKDIREFLDIVTSYGLMAYVTANFGVISLQELPETNVYRKLNQTLKEAEQIRLEVVSSVEEIYEKYAGQVLKGTCICPNPYILQSVKQEIKLKCPQLEVVSSWSNNFEVMKKDVSKGEAVNHLREYLNLTREEVKHYADYVTATNKEGGVSQAINRFVLMK